MRVLNTLLVALPFAFALPQSTVDIGSIQALSSKLIEAQNTISSIHNELDNLFNIAKPNLGNAAVSIDQAQAELNTGFQILTGALATMTAQMNNLGSTFQETDQTMNELWSRARK